MNPQDYEIRFLHHNVQSLSNKLLDIAIMLATEHSKINILCFTEHWLSEVQMKVLNIDGFRLASNFSRSYSTSGGSCIFTRNTIETKDVNYLKDLGQEKIFEISATELSTSNTILACIYRSPDSDFYTFLHILELLITKVSSKGKRLVLCGDLNVNFLQQNSKLEDHQNFLVMNNLRNLVKSPTRISNRSESLIDIMIINNTENETFSVNQLGLLRPSSTTFIYKNQKPNRESNN
jgi:exonuclease III